MYFSDKDKENIEKLKYNKKLKPGFEMLKSSLVWDDEIAVLSEDGFIKLGHLFVAISYIYHFGLKQKKSWLIDVNFFESQWELAIKSKVKWPGFEKERLYLSIDDKKYLDKHLNDKEIY